MVTLVVSTADDGPTLSFGPARSSMWVPIAHQEPEKRHGGRLAVKVYTRGPGAGLTAFINNIGSIIFHWTMEIRTNLKNVSRLLIFRHRWSFTSGGNGPFVGGASLTRSERDGD
nr:hypothetical protein Iba_chr03aCG7280 [Ipomoea batatas]